MSKLLKLAAVAATLSLMLWADHAQATPITTLFNTGVNSSGTPLLDNQSDSHYNLIAGPITGIPIVATSSNGWPLGSGPWIPDNSTSAWITPSTSTGGPVGNYTYRTSFDLTGLYYTTAQINGLWSSDNLGLDILINGVATGFTSNSLSSFSAFSISSGFVAGINTLDFVVNNANCGGCFNPTGLRVEMTGTTVPVNVPEPITLVLFGAGLVGIGVMHRPKKARGLMI